MTTQEFIKVLQETPGYLKKGSLFLQTKFNVSAEQVKSAKESIRESLNNEKDLAFEERLDELGLKASDVKNVKFWQNMAGENRFSIQTKDKWYENKELANSILDELKKSLKAELEPFFIPFTHVDEKKALFIYTADKHVGAKTSDRSIYKNEYNAEVFEARMQKLLQEVNLLHKLHGRFDRVYLVDLGDPLDGYNEGTTRGGHKLPQNMDNREQFDTYVNVHKKWFDTLVDMNVTNHIHFVAVTEDNHAGAFGYCANRAIEIYLNVKYPTITTRILSKFIEHIEYGNHAIMLSHGKDSEDMKHGFPKRLDQKTELFIDQYIRYFKLEGKTCHFIKGDLHQESNEFGKQFRYKNVLSLYGASKWIHSNFGVSMAGACFEVLEKHTHRLFQHSITF